MNDGVTAPRGWGLMTFRPPPDGQNLPGARTGGIREPLATGGLLVADGALGTMLHAKGLQRGDPPERWNLTRPQTVHEIHEAYLAVGCDLLETNTFGANRLRLQEYGLEGRVADINGAAVQLARRAGSAAHLVAGAVGPTGRFQGGKRKGPWSEIGSAFAEQVSHLNDGGVDLIMIETMSHLAEAQVALAGAQQGSAVPVAVSLVFFQHGRGLCTLDGASPHEAARELSAAQAVGCNCMDTADAGEVLRQMREATALPLIAQPHAGLPDGQEKPGIDPQNPEGWVRSLPLLLASRPAILGGCCGTTPAHLAALVRSLARS
ncbi:MAG: homocysteine S-methyltransferase family protein [Candidatus Methylomirabilales bacterium]